MADNSYWLKQDPTKPLFDDLIWSKPENKNQAGKLLIVGGNTHSFKDVNLAFTEAKKAGIGSCNIYLPDSLQRSLSKLLENGVYGPSTISGGFSRQALAKLMELSDWSDGVLLPGELGHNSETAVLLESFASKYQGLLAITKDALDYFTISPLTLLGRDQTLVIANFSQLQKMAMSVRHTSALTFNMDLLRLVNWLHEFTMMHESIIMLMHLDVIAVAYKGRVSTTKLQLDEKFWQVKAASHGIVWWIQNPNKMFEAITSSVVSG
jgi:hypothetical protein